MPENRLLNVERESARTSDRLDAHEKECALRYIALEKGVGDATDGIKDIKGKLEKGAYFLIAGMGAVIAALLKLIFLPS